MRAEGDIDKLFEVCELLIVEFQKEDHYLAGWVEEHGLDHVTKLFAKYIKESCLDDSGQTFSFDEDELHKAYTAMRMELLDDTLLKLVKDGILEMGLNAKGEFTFSLKKPGQGTSASDPSQWPPEA